MADSSDEFESDLSCESEYESVESSDEWEPITDSLNLIGSTANCTLNLPLRKHIFFAGNTKTKNNSVCENDISTKKRTLFAPGDGLLLVNYNITILRKFLVFNAISVTKTVLVLFLTF